jgi:hypothetical protein
MGDREHEGRRRRRSVRDDHLPSMNRIADADAAAVMDRDPGGAAYGVDKRVQEGPVGDGVAPIAHPFRLVARRCHGPGIQVVASDDKVRFPPNSEQRIRSTSNLGELQ